MRTWIRGYCACIIAVGPLLLAGTFRLGDERTISDYYSERGFAYLKKDDYAHAILDLDVAIRKNPKNARALKIRGLAYEARRDSARAEADLGAAKQLGE